MKIKDLKECPYCGGKAEFKRKKEKHTFLKGSTSKIIAALNDFYVRCSKCHVRTQAYNDKEKSLNAWNAGLAY